jgi:hypothetical protein
MHGCKNTSNVKFYQFMRNWGPLKRNNYTYQCLLNNVMACKINILKQYVIIQPDRKELETS